MPFPMIHLLTARKVLERTSAVEDVPAFYLGSIAPDCAHFSENFSGDLKKHTHLCIGDEQWGFVTDCSDWMQNVLEFYQKSRDFKPFDFILGYCTHILTDILNCEKLWIPFRNTHPISRDKLWSSDWHKEESMRDMLLYCLTESSPIFSLLSLSVPVGIPDIADERFVAAIRNNILNVQYSDVPEDIAFEGKYISTEVMEEFMETSADYIVKQLRL